MVPDIPSVPEKTSKDRALDLERIYGTLNGQARTSAQARQVETTIVSAVFSSVGYRLGPAREELFDCKGVDEGVNGNRNSCMD